MCIAGGLGAAIVMQSGLDSASALFSESTGRFLIEVRSDDDGETISELLDATYIGQVTAAPQLIIRHNDSLILEASIFELESAWRGETPVVPARPTPATTVKQRVTRISHGHTHPKVLILHANGTNRDHEAALACELAGGESEIVHINQLISGGRYLLDYHMLVVPGGFSYGDDLGAGVLWAQDLRRRLDVDMQRFVASGRPVLGICNGFQALVKSDLLPGSNFSPEPAVTLTHNESGRFECRWVYLQPNPNSPSLFTDGLTELIYCPVAHGEGRIAVRDSQTLQSLWDEGLVTLTYTDQTGGPIGYPGNPNGSASGIAGLCNPAGNVMGLMPHPEDHIFPTQHPRWHRGASGFFGLPLFKNGIRFA
jgi:phosphoribosylformylglycinamidine synthase